MEQLACDVLGLSPPVKVTFSGPAMDGSSHLNLVDANSLALRFGFCFKRESGKVQSQSRYLYSGGCRSLSSSGEIPAGSSTEIAVQILAGIHIRITSESVRDRLLSGNLRDGGNQQGERRIVVRPVQDIVDIPHELARLRHVDYLRDSFAPDFDRFWALRFILCCDSDIEA